MSNSKVNPELDLNISVKEFLLLKEIRKWGNGTISSYKSKVEQDYGVKLRQSYVFQLFERMVEKKILGRSNENADDTASTNVRPYYMRDEKYIDETLKEITDIVNLDINNDYSSVQEDNENEVSYQSVKQNNSEKINSKMILNTFSKMDLREKLTLVDSLLMDINEFEPIQIEYKLKPNLDKEDQ